MDYEVPKDGSGTIGPRALGLAARAVTVSPVPFPYSRRACGSNRPNAFTYRQPFRKLSSFNARKTKMTSALVVGPRRA